MSHFERLSGRYLAKHIPNARYVELPGSDHVPWAGLHTGEVELMGEKVGGIAVHIGARVAAQAQPGEILASHTVRDLVAGSGLRLADRGARSLDGVPGERRLFALDREFT